MNETRRSIVFVSGIDPALSGIEINGFKLKLTHKTPCSNDDDSIAPGNRAFDLGTHFLSLSDSLSHGYNYLHDINSNDFFMYFEKLTSDSYKSHLEAIHLINCLRLFKNSNIGFYCPLSVNSVGGCGAFPDVHHTYHSIYEFSAGKLSNIDHMALDQFYRDTYSQKYSITVEKMLQLFHDSYRIHSKEIKLIQRVTILEMLVDGNAELVNRISRTVAVFLGRTVEESRDIFTRTKKIYEARSKYLHDGNSSKIDINVMNDALELSRRIIANLMYIKCDMSEFRRITNEAGYGTNPFDVKI